PRSRRIWSTAGAASAATDAATPNAKTTEFADESRAGPAFPVVRDSSSADRETDRATADAATKMSASGTSGVRSTGTGATAARVRVTAANGTAFRASLQRTAPRASDTTRQR